MKPRKKTDRAEEKQEEISTNHVLVIVKLILLLLQFIGFLFISLQGHVQVKHGKGPEGHIKLGAETRDGKRHSDAFTEAIRE